MGYWMLDHANNAYYYVRTIEDELGWIISLAIILGIPCLILLVYLFSNCLAGCCVWLPLVQAMLLVVSSANIYPGIPGTSTQDTSTQAHN